jgi:hypothetical protein
LQEKKERKAKSINMTSMHRSPRLLLPTEDPPQERRRDEGDDRSSSSLSPSDANSELEESVLVVKVDKVSRISYVVAIPKEGMPERAIYVGALQDSMDVLALQYALPGMTVNIPTSVDGIIETSTLLTYQVLILY